MTRLFLFISILLILPFSTSADGPLTWISSFIDGWMALSEPEKCTACAQLVYGLVLTDDISLAESAAGLAFQYTVCPWVSQVIYQNETAIDSSQCSSTISTGFNFFYPLFYYPAKPFRDFICIPLCGNSGRQFYD